MSPFEVYLMMQADTLIGISILGLIISFMCIITGYAITNCDGKNDLVKYRKFYRKSVISACICTLILIFTPTTRSLALMNANPTVTSPECARQNSKFMELIKVHLSGIATAIPKLGEKQ